MMMVRAMLEGIHVEWKLKHNYVSAISKKAKKKHSIIVIAYDTFYRGILSVDNYLTQYIP